MMASPIPQAVVGDALDETVLRAARVLAVGCHARAVAVWLAEPAILATVGASKADSTEAVNEYLKGVVKADWRSKPKNVFYSTLIGDRVFAWVGLHHTDMTLGAVALDFSAEDWSKDTVQATLQAMVPMLSIVSANSLLTHQLEADLAAASDRADTLARNGEIDKLTALENKASFEAKCTDRLRRDRRPVAMLAIDLDDFKQVNDVYGHLFGDRYLTEVANALSVILPKTCIIGRTGGDEFCILIEIPEAGRRYLRTIILNIRQSIQRCIATLGKPDLGGLSIGVSLFPTQATTFRELWELADCALYASKRTERNTTTIYSSELEGLMEPADLRDNANGFQFDRLVAHVQPIIDVQSGDRVGLEILARWRDRTGVLRPPDSFSWVFRDHRFASEVTFQVVESALEQLCLQCGMHPETLPQLWINVTDSDFLNSDFVFDLQAILERYRVDWEKIVLEVNEDTIIGPRNGLVFNALKEVRRRGGRVALDDFGTGQSGLTHACQWPVDCIKLDRGIVQRLGSDERTGILVEAIVMVANRLGQVVLAEGIETEAQLKNAKRAGCTLGQGFHLGRPGAPQNAQKYAEASEQEPWTI